VDELDASMWYSIIGSQERVKLSPLRLEWDEIFDETIKQEVVDEDPQLVALNELIHRLASRQTKTPLHLRTTIIDLILNPDVNTIGYFIKHDLSYQITHIHRLLDYIFNETGVKCHFKRAKSSVEFQNGTLLRVIDFRDKHERYRGLKFDAIWHFEHGLMYPVGHNQLGEIE